RFGSRRVLTAGALWWGMFTVLTALVPAGVSAPLLCFGAVCFMLGTGEMVIYPSSNRFVASWIPTSERGIAKGGIFAGVGGGAAFVAASSLCIVGLPCGSSSTRRKHCLAERRPGECD